MENYFLVFYVESEMLSNNEDIYYMAHNLWNLLRYIYNVWDLWISYDILN